MELSSGSEPPRSEAGGGPAPTVLYPPRLRLLVLAATCALFVLICLVPTRADAVLLVVLGWLGVVAFGLAGALLLGRALRPGPTLVIDDDGITDRTTLAPIGRLPWAQIAAVREREIGRGRGREALLEIVLVDPERFRSRPRSPARRLTDRYRDLAGQPYVGVPASMVSRPIPKVIELMQRRRPDLLVMRLPPAAHRPPRQHRPGPSQSPHRRR